MEMLQILAPDGTLTGEAPLSVDEVRRLFRAMVAGRAYDHKATAMQKQGRLATYASFEGQEAAQIGSVAALEERDWVVGTYRDAAAMWFHGYPWVNLILGRTGDERGGHAPDGVNVMPPSITVGAHMIHAVGLGWSERLLGSDAVAMTYFGDGATSEGDFHEAMNFAGVYRTPTVFVCQNNGWAISMPTSRQTASETIAQKAIAYGMPGVRVDGNDLLAMYQVSRDAVARARAGEGPTLIEAVTYRVGPHTTTDDPDRYRDGEEAAEWRSRDPIARVRAYLQADGAWDAEWEADIEQTEHDAVERAVDEAEALEPFGAGEIFDAMYAEPTPQLIEQRDKSIGR
ncbi:MAG: pyruvate dehydrogenase (acetyl-transferring) E1 component subunit alpha [Acidimicrobiia bacterium]|nr:pyruvate dehydrogenase (acetyl-transferring) E1 component subunit alpha [Acidimicrobiia bacterium]